MGQIDRLNRKDKEMKFMIPFLMAAVLPAAALPQSQAGTQSPSGAQTQPAGGSGVPSIAIPKTTEVIVIETPKQGVRPQQVMAVEPRGVSVSHVSTAVLYDVTSGARPREGPYRRHQP